MHLAQPRLLWEFFLCEVEDDGEDEAEREADEECRVLAALAEDLSWADGAPEHGCGEKSVDARAGEVVLLRWRAHVWDPVHLVVENSGADECGDERGDHLSEEGVSRGDLDVVGQLQVVGKTKSGGAGYVSANGL